MSKKILLVSANIFTLPYPVYPLGISYVATYLRTTFSDYDIKLFDFNLGKESDFIALLYQFSPDHIGISIRNIDDVNFLIRENFVAGYKRIKDLCRSNSNATITIGGSGFSIYPKLLYENLQPDFGICGEGEESYRQLLSCLDTKQNYESIEGLIFTRNGKIIQNGRKNFSSDLGLNLDDNLIDFYWQNSGMLNIQTKRGCPFSCIFCTYPVIEGNRVRTLNADKIADTISELFHKNGIDYFFFTDSIFNIDDEFNLNLAEKLIAKKISIRWGAYFSPYNLKEQHLKTYKKSGLYHIEFGTDSLSDTQLRNYDKKFTVRDILEKSDLCNRLGIHFAHFLILGGYGETEVTIDETFENSKKIDNSVFFPFVGMRIYPGTKLQQIAIDEGLISADDKLLDSKYYVSDNFNIATLKEKAMKTGRRWVFPDEDLTDGMMKFRRKNIKGPLWEYLII